MKVHSLWIHPSQLVRPEQRLAAAVIEQAFSDYFGSDPGLREEAIRFLLSEDEDEVHGRECWFYLLGRGEVTAEWINGVLDRYRVACAGAIAKAEYFYRKAKEREERSAVARKARRDRWAEIKQKNLDDYHSRIKAAKDLHAKEIAEIKRQVKDKDCELKLTLAKLHQQYNDNCHDIRTRISAEVVERINAEKAEKAETRKNAPRVKKEEETK